MIKRRWTKWTHLFRFFFVFSSLKSLSFWLSSKSIFRSLVFVNPMISVIYNFMFYVISIQIWSLKWMQITLFKRSEKTWMPFNGSKKVLIKLDELFYIDVSRKSLKICSGSKLLFAVWLWFIFNFSSFFFLKGRQTPLLNSKLQKLPKMLSAFWFRRWFPRKFFSDFTNFFESFRIFKKFTYWTRFFKLAYVNKKCLF